MDRSQLVRGGLLYGARISYGVLLLSASIVIARLYGAYGLGVYALLLTVTNLGGIVGAFGMNTVLLERLPGLRMRSDASQAQAHYLRSLLVFVTVTGLVATAVSALVTSVMVPELAWSSVTVLFITWSTLFLSLLISQRRQLLAATLESVVRPAVYVILLLLLGAAVTGSLRLTVNTALISSLGLLALIAGVYYLRTARVDSSAAAPEDATLTRAHIRHGGVYMVIALMTAAAQQLDRFVLELLATTSDVGIYSSAQNVMNIVTYAMLALMSLLLPAIAEWQAGSMDDAAFVRRCRLVSRALTALALGVVLVCVVGGELVLGIFGPDFVAGRWALVVLAAGQVLTAAFGVATTVLSIGDHRITALWITIGTVVLNVALCFALIPLWGITGAAAANALAQISNRLAGHIILKRRSGLSLVAW